MNTLIIITFIRLFLILPFYLCNTFSYEKHVIVRSNREYDYFPSYSSTSTKKVLVLEYEYKYMSTITPSLLQS